MRKRHWLGSLTTVHCVYTVCIYRELRRIRSVVEREPVVVGSIPENRL